MVDVSKTVQTQGDYQERLAKAKEARDEAMGDVTSAKKDYYSTQYEYGSIYTRYTEEVNRQKSNYSDEKEWEQAKSGVTSSLSEKFGIGKMNKTKFQTSLNFDLAIDRSRRANEWLAKMNNISVFFN